jgi:hypothetical protein
MLHKNLILLFLLAAFQPVLAQQDDFSAKILNFSLREDVVDKEGRRGIGLKFDLRMTPAETEFDRRRFDLTWKLTDKTGKVIYQSKDQEDYLDQKKSIMARKPWNNSSARYMEKQHVEIALPYNHLPLPDGEQKVTIVFSLNGKYGNLPEFARKELSFRQHVFTKHSLQEQTFSVSNMRFNYSAEGFAVDEPGIKMSFDLTPQYGPDESIEEGYTLYWLFRQPDGKVVFDSRKAQSIHHREEHVYLKNLRDGKFRDVSVFLNYDEIKMPGPAEVYVVLIAESDEEHHREIYAEKHMLNVPEKFRFEDQKFELSGLRAGAGFRKGASGLFIECEISLDNIGPRMDPEIGDYYVYPVLRNPKGEIVYSPKYLEPPAMASSRLAENLPALKDEGPVKVKLFLPWYVLQLSPGTATLQYTLKVSDRQRRYKFPVLSKGGISVRTPELRRYKINLVELLMKDSNYDTEVMPISSRLPDLQWTLRVGRDNRFISPKRKNSLRAPTGSSTVSIAVGDTLSVVLYDIDSGFFNNSDFLGSWQLPYQERGERFTIEEHNNGLVDHLKLEVTRVQ